MLIPSSFISPAVSVEVGASTFARHAAYAPAISASTVASTALTMVTATSSLSITSLPVALSLCGGAKTAFDLTRARVRLEGLHMYAVITTLMLNSALRLFSSTPKRTADATNAKEYFENAVKFIFTLVMMLAVLSGSYTTIVFSLLGLYSKRAIGVGQDEQFLEFFALTKEIRESGYHAFIISIVTFKASFALSLFLNYRGWPRWFFLFASIIFTCWAWCRWSTIMQIAASVLGL